MTRLGFERRRPDGTLTGAGALAALALAGCMSTPALADATGPVPAAEPAGAVAALTEAAEPEAPPVSEARALHERLLTLDSHLDTPLLFGRPGFDIMARQSVEQDFAQVDLPRMIEGGLDGGFWVIYTAQGPLTPEAYRTARDSALGRAVEIQKMVAANPDHFELATRPEDAARIAADGKRIVYQSIENAYPLGEDVSLLSAFHELGVRMLGPVHFTNNQFADSSTDEAGAVHGGLSPLGEELVHEANRLGMILDASHAHDLAFDDMVELSATPIILSHSGAKDVFGHPRNVDDERLLKLAETGGVIQMNAFGAYLTELEQNEERRAALAELFAELRALGSDADPEAYAALMERRRAINAQFPPDMADFEDYMAHFLHVLELVGPDHVGVGADWDGGGGVIGMNEVSAFPKITERLLAEGYTEDDLAKIWGGNLLRLLGEAEAYAAGLAAESMEADAAETG